MKDDVNQVLIMVLVPMVVEELHQIEDVQHSHTIVVVQQVTLDNLDDEIAMVVMVVVEVKYHYLLLALSAWH
jgi:hypothetical protein